MIDAPYSQVISGSTGSAATLSQNGGIVVLNSANAGNSVLSFASTAGGNGIRVSALQGNNWAINGGNLQIHVGAASLLDGNVSDMSGDYGTIAAQNSIQIDQGAIILTSLVGGPTSTAQIYNPLTGTLGGQVILGITSAAAERDGRPRLKLGDLFRRAVQ